MPLNDPLALAGRPHYHRFPEEPQVSIFGRDGLPSAENSGDDLIFLHSCVWAVRFGSTEVPA